MKPVFHPIKKRLFFLIFLFNFFSSFSQNEKAVQAISCQNWSTFFGGNGQEEIKGIAGDGNGNILAAGITNSTDLFTTTGLIGDTLKGDYDGFVAKFDSCGNLVWATYLGSTFYDGAEKILIGENNSVFICGYTMGNDFPVSAGAYQTSGNGYESFLMKLDANGNLLWSTLFGGNGGDLGYDIALDKNKNIYLGGSTSSTNLPTTFSSLQQNAGGSLDAFLVSFTTNGNFRWCTYFGGSGSEDVHVMCNDKSGNIFLAGGTFSQNINMGVNAWQPVNNGAMDVYLLKTDSLGNKLWSTYLGDTGQDDCYGLVCDSAENVYVSGLTNSANFPVTPGCYQPLKSLYADIYLGKFSSSGNLIWNTFLGGSDLEDCKSLTINSNQEITLLGRTMSADIPVIGTPLQANLNGTANYDLYIARCDSAGNFFWGSYLGGTNEEANYDLVNSGTNYCYLAGGSYSGDYPVTSGSFQTTISTPEDGIVTKISVPANPTLGLSQNTKTGNEIIIYPNPAKDKIRVLCDEEIVSVLVRDLNGQIVLERNPVKKNMVEFNVDKFTPGIYFAEIKLTERVFRKKFLIE